MGATIIANFLSFRTFGRSVFVRPLLLQSETRIEKAGFRSETNNGIIMQLDKRLFNPRFFDYDFQLDQTVKKN